MQIIPVIDLKNGHVVHAKRGQREHYAPIKSLLSTSSHAHDVVAGLLKLYPFPQIYIADIDAISGSGSHAELVATMCQNFPHVVWWLDNGLHYSDHTSNLRMVIGSESIANMQDYPENLQNHILSLDVFDGKVLGAAALHRNSALWPSDVICMSLNAVGANNGVDLERIAALQQLGPNVNIYAAGGVRNAQDLHTLKNIGAAGALMATALHQGQISTREIAVLMQ